jgi:glycosyltransferase involved in cell wall biosynthesis
MERPLRVAYITHYTELYGANRSLLDLLRALRDHQGVVPHVVLPSTGALNVELDRLGIPWAIIPFQPWMSERHYSGRWYHRLAQHLRQRREARARIAHNAGLGPALAEQLHAWDITIVHANSAAVALVPTVLALGEWPLVWHIRELPEAHYGLQFDGGRERYANALHGAAHVVVISDAVRSDIRSRAGELPRVTRIHDGVLSTERMLELARTARDRSAAGRAFSLLQVGLIHPSKGQLEAVDAVHLLRRQGKAVRLIIAGTGRDKALRARIAELDLGAQVELRGYVSDPSPLYQGADVLLMCSRHEALGRVTIEAMACGLPVIGHRSGATPEVLGDGAFGLLREGGPEELALAIDRMMQDTHLREQLTTAARTSVLERFTTERCGAAVRAVYDKVVSATAS